MMGSPVFCCYCRACPVRAESECLSSCVMCFVMLGTVYSTRDTTIIHLFVKSIFITEGIYCHHTDRLHKNCNNNDFTPFYFKLDNFNVLNILL